MNRDLVVLCADVDIEATIRTLVTKRFSALGIRRVTAEFIRAPHRDPGTFRDAPALLSTYAGDFRHALVVFDEAWEGRPGDASWMAQDVERRLEPAWTGRARCVVVSPEIEVWAFSDSPRVADVMGRGGPELKTWLSTRGLWSSEDPKPRDPKRAFEAVMRDARRNPAAAAFARLAESVSVDRCTDPSFVALRTTLREWFPPS